MDRVLAEDGGSPPVQQGILGKYGGPLITSPATQHLKKKIGKAVKGEMRGEKENGTEKEEKDAEKEE